MAVASYILVTYIPDAPPSCGFFSHLSSWKILRHHPRFLAVFPTPTSTRPVRPSSSVDIDGVPGAPPTVRGDGTPPPSPSSASGGGRSTVAVELPGPMPTRSKRTKDQAGLLEASASMAKRVKELTDASSSKSETLKNMERSMFFNTSEMRNMQAAGDFQQRTAARMLTEMEEEDRKSAARHAQASVGWRREAEETLRLKAIADAEAESAARRAASHAERLAAKTAETAEAAARVRAAAAAGTDASAAADAAGNEEGEGGWEDGEGGAGVHGRHGRCFPCRWRGGQCCGRNYVALWCGSVCSRRRHRDRPARWSWLWWKPLSPSACGGLASGSRPNIPLVLGRRCCRHRRSSSRRRLAARRWRRRHQHCLTPPLELPGCLGAAAQAAAASRLWGRRRRRRRRDYGWRRRARLLLAEGGGGRRRPVGGWWGHHSSWVAVFSSVGRFQVSMLWCGPLARCHCSRRPSCAGLRRLVVFFFKGFCWVVFYSMQ